MRESAALSLPAHSPMRSFYRIVLHYWMRFSVRDLNRARIARVDDVWLIVLPGVFDGVRLRTGVFLARTLDTVPINAQTHALDLGTGTGIGAVFAAQRGASVLATDIAPEAVRCARINALANHLEAHIEARVGDLFAPVRGERFDLILFNPPYFRGTARDMADRAWRSPEVFDRFLRELAAHLSEHGRALVVLSSDNEIEAALHNAHHLQVRVLSRRDMINEILMVYEIRNA